MRDKLRNDPFFMPTFEELKKHLGRFRRYLPKDDPEWQEELRKWIDLVEDRTHPIYEIWTKEYINAFGNYLAKRVEELGGTEERPIVILEVGAGNGKLTHFLQEKMDELMPKRVKIVASDSGDWKIPSVFPVDNISHSEALQKYQPAIVIFSWMPWRYDCTADFRAAKSVDEYILIGEASGCCGDEWLTWGDVWVLGEEEYEKHKNELPPFEADGFESIWHEDLEKLQFSRIDITEGNSTSTTTSFRRKKQ